MSATVAYVIEDLGLGGMERALARFALLARDAGFEVRVICTRAGGPVADDLKKDGVRVDVLAKSGALDLARALNAEGPLLVHSHGAVRSLARRAARLARPAGVIHHLHGTERFGLKQRLFERTLPPSLYLACSEFVKDDFQRQVGAANVEVLYNPVDAERFRFSEESRRAGRRELGAGEDTFVVACMARFSPDKGQRFLIEAVPRILAAHADSMIVFIGDGPSRPDVERWAAPFGRAVRFVGIRQDAVALLNACDVYAQPSVHREGLGLAALEALACERPVVASSLQGLSEAVGSTGILVPPGDSSALAEAILAQRGKSGAAGREHVLRRFSRAVVGPRLVEIYRGLLAYR